MNMDKKQ